MMNDKRDVIDWLNDVAEDKDWTMYYSESERQMLAKDALSLLKAQEPIKPIYKEEKYGDHLPHCWNCEKVLPNNAVYGKVNFCHYCGMAVKWNG